MTHSRSKVSNSYIGLLWPPEKYKQQHSWVTIVKKENGKKKSGSLWQKNNDEQKWDNIVAGKTSKQAET